MILIHRFKQIIKRTIVVRIIRLINSTYTKGDIVHCILCENNFKIFLPYGKPKRDNAQCPFCLSLERERLLWHYLCNNTKILKTGIKILHIAPETMFFDKLKVIHAQNYVPADKLSLGNWYPKGTKDIDILNIPFENNHFDMILCNHVLEHIEDDQKAMKELFRVLKEDGLAILLVPIDKNREITFEDFSITDPKMREKYFGKYDHVRVYGLDYSARLHSIGFNVKVINYTSCFDESEIYRFGFAKDEDIFLCSKALIS